MITQKILNTLRDVHDFPKPGIVFKDITPIFQSAELSNEIVDHLYQVYKDQNIDVVVGIESRGFFFGFPLAMKLGVPFVPIRKKGKLPYDTISFKYDLEYGSAEMEMHVDAILPGQRVLIHDDLLATGGTAIAASKIIGMCDAEIAGFSFIIDLAFLKGKDRINMYSKEISVLAEV